ncbi:FAD-binding protein [Candidatus Saccharibacteria bacterium]|nr:FAD-binding protein [Candidatus Saccharibacteria bacterium]
MIIRENVKLSELTTMRLGGPADFLIEIEDPNECAEAFEFAEEKNLPVYFLGLGANTIALDSGFPGVIIKNNIKGFKILEESSADSPKNSPRTSSKSSDKQSPSKASKYPPETLLIEVGGGEIWDDFVEFVTKKGFSGVEAMSKIPGTVAAAPVQNIGAYGQEVSQTLVSVEAFDSLLDEYVEIPASEMDFAYRHSIFNSGETAGRYFILTCTFRLEKKNPEPPFYNSLQSYLDAHKITSFTPEVIRHAVSEIRAEKLPDPAEIPSAGSFFKNIYLDKSSARLAEEKGIPVRKTEKTDKSGKSFIEYKVNTGWLLENAGLKGKLFHGFRVSDKAALILINESASSENDLELAKQEISAAVREKFGLTLEQEPVFIKPHTEETSENPETTSEKKSSEPNKISKNSSERNS